MSAPSMTLDAYIRDPAPSPSLSASLAHRLLTRSARHAWLAHPRLNPNWVPESSDAMDLGTIVHGMLLEGDVTRVVPIDAPDWRTKEAKAQRDAAHAAGKVPILVHKLIEATAMVEAARRAIDASELAPVFAAGKAEQTFVWSEGETWCRSRPDWVSDDHRWLVDLKTTAGSAEPEAWSRGPLLTGYDIQAAFALRGLRAAFPALTHTPAFVFAVLETEPPYAMSFVGLTPEWESLADRKAAKALAIWRHCLDTNEWPGYPSRIAWAVPPAWAEAQWMEREEVSQ